MTKTERILNKEFNKHFDTKGDYIQCQKYYELDEGEYLLHEAFGESEIRYDENKWWEVNWYRTLPKPWDIEELEALSKEDAILLP